MTVRTVTDLAPSTVTDFSTGDVEPIHTSPADRVRPRLSVRARKVHAVALAVALDAADGDPNRLWFGVDGAAWTLNHTRADRCTSPACPMCTEVHDALFR
jgi:hypothetical protein